MSRALLLAAIVVCCAQCRRDKAPTSGPDAVVARVGDRAITLAELERRLGELSPLARAKHQTPADRRKFLDTVIEREVLAAEARRRGYDRRPEIQKMLNDYISAALVRDEVDAKLKPEDVPDHEVQKYYREHESEFSRPEEVRASTIVVADEAKAQKLATEAKKTDEKAFRLLVAKHSEDVDSKSRGGDLGFFDRRTRRYPAAVVEAALKLNTTGEISPPVRTDRGFHILRLEQKRPGFARALPEVKDQLRRQLLSTVRTRRIAELATRARAENKIEIFEDRLAKK
jgi:peptidyl-prolyl cis-trans isomerase C